MIPGDEVLQYCNETELQQLARALGFPPLRSGLPKDDLIAIVAGDLTPSDEIEFVNRRVSSTQYTRGKLEGFIKLHWLKVMSQLPGCNGQCSTYTCSEGKHLLCFAPNQGSVQ